MLKPHVRILIVAALCVAALIGLVVREGMARAGGQEVLLAMQPVDPRALLGGHYVIVTLQEPLAAETPCPPRTPRHSMPRGGRYGWLALAPAADHHIVAGAAEARAEAEALGPIAVRGTAACFKPDDPETGEAAAGFVSVDLGVSRFYASQALAERIERAIRQSRGPGASQRVYAILSIGADGRARLSGLEVEGERLMLDWR